MREDSFYLSNHMTAELEYFITKINTLEEFEKRFPPEFLDDDQHVGVYLERVCEKISVNRISCDRIYA